MQAPGMDIRSAQYLVAVVDHGSVTAAADVLRISQPSLSQAVRNLERALGATLFERTTRGLAPTTVGLAITDSARALLADVARAEAAVATVTALRAGELAIAVQSDLAIDPVAEVAGRLHLTAPGIRFSTNAVPNAQDVRALVRAGTCELGFLETHPGTDVSDGLREIAVSTQETVLSIPVRLATDHPDPVPRAVVAHLPMVVEASTFRRGRSIDGDLELTNVVVEVPDRLAVREMVGQGVGAALLPRSIAEQDSPASEVRSLLPPITRQTILVYRDGPLSPAGSAYIENVSTRHKPPTNSLPNGESVSGSNSMP
ncbi:LysR family transcriptional regulator [Rhodococcus cerastii]|jgi:LysR family cyn operon transcriptional activator|uniref:LysR family transcriptional regulator n=1 Tax=Rhodococcus erythropolis TaxID=1833 RepID=UPI001291DBFA|nr:LysR family transcriptional regulator [Rhodococcus erythropolis]MCD2152532.1 LysR family transcriptional regulator [Rhodococcus cerastii]MQP32285.1 LysR family transcriptional regulator [Rhodococcus erythropolis]